MVGGVVTATGGTAVVVTGAERCAAVVRRGMATRDVGAAAAGATAEAGNVADAGGAVSAVLVGATAVPRRPAMPTTAMYTAQPVTTSAPSATPQRPPRAGAVRRSYPVSWTTSPSQYGS